MVMLAYAADVIKLLRSKIGRRIAILVFIQIFFIVASLVVLSYYLDVQPVGKPYYQDDYQQNYPNDCQQNYVKY